jgi:Putative metallopeptidase
VRDAFEPSGFPSPWVVRRRDAKFSQGPLPGMANAWYQRPKVTICYEYVDDIDKGVRKETHDGSTHNDAVLGQFIYVVAHEMGHALFDTLNVPLFGQAEDAADEFSTYMMLSFGKQDARRLIHRAA